MSRKNGGIIGPVNTPVGGLVTGIAGGVWRMNDVANLVSNSQWPIAASPGENSCRFNVGDSDSLSRTPTTAGNRKTFTLSVWCKKMSSSQMNFMGAGGTSDQNHISFENDRLQIRHYNGSSNDIIVNTSAVFRDESAWYHFVVAVDTTQSTNSDRVKLYANGSLQSLNDTTYPSQDYEWNFNDTEIQYVGRRQHSSAYHFDGYMAEFTWVDGQQLTPSSFGETNSATGIWTAKDIGRQLAPLGTNGFYLDFKDSSNLGKDVSGNSNDFTVNNLTSLDQTTDITSNNFCTQHPLSYRSGQTVPTYSDGNLKVVFAAGVNTFSYGTLGVQAGKWYWEVKVTFGSNVYTGIGFASAATNTDINGYLLRQTGQKYNTSGSASSYASALSTGDTVMIAFDADNGTLWFGVNGTWSNSATQSEIENGTTSNSAFSSIDMSSIWLPLSKGGTSSNSNIQANFGNPIYSISSGNSDANGHGNFEYAVPSGYYALNTSNLNTYG
tara:strand:- start:674 stop:2158 length:1485 start_codon:yes stop_codon:yes gene_type:complete